MSETIDLEPDAYFLGRVLAIADEAIVRETPDPMLRGMLRKALEVGDYKLKPERGPDGDLWWSLSILGGVELFSAPTRLIDPHGRTIDDETLASWRAAPR